MDNQYTQDIKHSCKRNWTVYCTWSDQCIS